MNKEKDSIEEKDIHNNPQTDYSDSFDDFDMPKPSSGSSKKGLIIAIIIVLILILSGGGYYIFRQKQEMESLVSAFNLEKESLEDEYTELSLQYEGYMFSINNDSLVTLLNTEQMKVERLLEELRTVKATNANRINELKRELATLREIMRGYVAQIDSLSKENETLKTQKTEVEQKYRRASNQAAQLAKDKEHLTERVSLASMLDASNIQVSTVNAKGKVQKKIKRMEQFVITFILARNVTAPVGEKTLFIRIMKPDDTILMKNNSGTFDFEGRQLNYSIKKTIEYDGEEVPVTMYWDIEEFLSPGTYRVDVFADGNQIGRRSFTLED